MQSKRQSIIEVALGTVIGLTTSFVIQIIIYPLLNIPISINENLIITLIFFIASLLRSYLVRRMFNKIFNKDESK
tara:strand:+ start:1976 stop:2200 length:225 start_codon:yes stop_codon:yes gene_type:complete